MCKVFDASSLRLRNKNKCYLSSKRRSLFLMSLPVLFCFFQIFSVLAFFSYIKWNHQMKEFSFIELLSRKKWEFAIHPHENICIDWTSDFMTVKEPIFTRFFPCFLPHDDLMQQWAWNFLTDFPSQVRIWSTN